MKKTKLSTDRILGLSAMLISLLTLIIFIYQTNLIREQSRLSVRPRIAFTQSQKGVDSTINISARIVNKGLGPAIIESINIVHKNKKYDLNFGEFMEQVFPDIYKFGTLDSQTTLTKGSTLSPNEVITYYSFTFKADQVTNLLNYLEVDIKEGENPFLIEVTYSSIYNEKWYTDNKKNGHPRLL